MDTLVRDRLIREARRAPIRFLTRPFIEYRLRDADRHPDRYCCIEGLPIPRPGFVDIQGLSVPPIAGGAANSSPIFPLTPLRGFATITVQNTATDGTGTVNTLITGGANGSLFTRLLALPLGNGNQTKIYVFWNNGGNQTVATNNALIRDIPVPAGVASNTALIGSPVEVPFMIPLASGDTINTTISAAMAAGWKTIAIAGSY